jgi:hypothetical protein
MSAGNAENSSRSAGDKEARIGFFQIRTINFPAQSNHLRAPATVAAFVRPHIHKT